MNAEVMVDRAMIPGDYTVFVAGNDADAEATASDLLRSFGWRAEQVLEFGDITPARGTEMLLPLWLRLYGATDTGRPNIAVRPAPDG